MPNKKKYEHGGKVEDETGPESEAVEIEATLHESEYVLSIETVEALGEEWLDAINKAFQDDSEANPLWILIQSMDLLPNAEESSKVKPAMSGRSEYSNYEMSPAALEALGHKFLSTLETFLRLSPNSDPRKALNSSAEYLKDKKVRSYKSGGKIIGTDPVR